MRADNSIKIASQLESVEFVKAKSISDEWKAIHQPSNTVTDGWTSEEVNDRVESLKEKGWKQK